MLLNPKVWNKADDGQESASKTHAPPSRHQLPQSMRQVTNRHQATDAYPSNAESRRPPPSHLSQLPARIPDYQHILTNLVFGKISIGENVLLTRNHLFTSYMNSFNNNRHIQFCRDVFLVGVTHTNIDY